MVGEIEITDIDFKDTSVLEKFIENAGDSTKSFRYFANRPLNVISNHLKTIIALNEKNPVGYGHLDREGSNIWLGIAVTENYKGKGLGKKLMNHLIDYADNSCIPELFLSVDKNNKIAIDMYRKYNFSEVKELSNQSFIMKRKREE